MTHTDKKQIRQEKDIRWEIDGCSLSSVIKTLSNYKEYYGDIELDIGVFMDYGSPACSVELVFYREETDIEQESRIAREEALEESRKAYELKQLEELKKKYEST